MITFDQKKQEAINYLTKIGLFIPFDSMDLYHGRTKKDSETTTWVVNENINNSDNNTSHNNINTISALSTGDKDLASAYAKVRASQEGGTPELHKIESLIDNALIINTSFSLRKLSDSEKNLMMNHLKWLTNYKVSELVPIDFKMKKQAEIVYNIMLSKFEKSPVSFYTFQEHMIDVYAEAYKKDMTITQKFVEEIMGAYNAKRLIIKDPGYALAYFYDNFTPSYTNENNQECPINKDYLAALIHHTGIVGYKKFQITSGNVNQTFDACYLFDLKNINTQKAKGEKIQAVMNTYAGLLDFFSDDNILNVNKYPLLMKSSPETITKSLKRDKDFSKYLSHQEFDGLTCGQHIESMIRLFNENLSNNIPNELYPLINLSIIAPRLARVKYKYEEHEKSYSRCFKEIANKLHFSDKLTKFIYFTDVCKKGEEKSTTGELEYYQNIFESDSNINNFYKLFGKKPNNEEIKGINSFTKIITACRRGQFSNQAIFYDDETEKYYHYHDEHNKFLWDDIIKDL